MRPGDLSSHISQWFDGISSRIRLARNLAGYNFLPCMTDEEKRSTVETLKDTLLSIDLGQDISFIDVDGSTSLEQDLLVERHLISRQHAHGAGPRGAVISGDETFTAMINEEDHLRIQVFQTGLQLDKLMLI